MRARVARNDEPAPAARAVVPELSHRPGRIIPQVDVFVELLGRVGRTRIGPRKATGAEIAEFLRVALSQEGQQAVARTLFLPLPANVVSEELKKLD